MDMEIQAMDMDTAMLVDVMVLEAEIGFGLLS